MSPIKYIRMTPIDGIKEKDCSTKNNLFNIEFPIRGLGEPNIYQNLVDFTRIRGGYLEVFLYLLDRFRLWCFFVI